jgi:hypothetical protein
VFEIKTTCSAKFAAPVVCISTVYYRYAKKIDLNPCRLRRKLLAPPLHSREAMKNSRWVLFVTFSLVAVNSISGCSTPTTNASREVGFISGGGNAQGPISQIELQEALQRFAGQFIQRIVDASSPNSIGLPSARLHTATIRHVLVYSSSILEITSGPYPEVNLLDMATFVTLNKHSLEKYWVPKVYGDQAKPLLAAFEASERDLNYLRQRVLSSEQNRKLSQVIARWETNNPDLKSVEWVRLSIFALQAGAVAKAQADEASGLMASVKGAVTVGDQAILLANRAMFLGQRMPFLLRLQARLGTREISDDLLSEFEQTRSIASTANSFRPLTSDLASLAANTQKIISKLDPMMKYFRENFPRDPKYTFTDKLLIGERVVEKSNDLLTKFNRLFFSATFALLVVGIGWAITFWTGYYLAKRKVTRSNV